jgi:hypothetical protein
VSEDEIPQDELAGDKLANYTIKNLPLRARMRASNAARMAGRPLGQWMDWAIGLAADQQERNAVLPGGDSRALVPPGAEATAPALPGATVAPPDPMLCLVHAAVALSGVGVRNTKVVRQARDLVSRKLLEL